MHVCIYIYIYICGCDELLELMRSLSRPPAELDSSSSCYSRARPPGLPSTVAYSGYSLQGGAVGGGCSGWG